MKKMSTVWLTLILLVLGLNLNAQSLLISGTVTDETNEPLIGVNIYEKGNETKGVITDVNGNYQLTVTSANAIVSYSFIGLNKQVINVQGRSKIDLVLVSEALGIDEVVVTALGMERETKALGFSVQEISGSDIQKAKESNVLSNLTGKVAGLTVYNKTDFYSTPDISLRGAEPLIVINGIPTSTKLWDVSSEDIEDISVLKGATASALYGSKGANGAIMIILKKGNTSEVSIDISSSTMFKAGYVAIPEPQTQYGTGDNGQYKYVDGKGGGINDAGTWVWGPKLDERDPSTKSGWKEIAQWDSPLDSEGNRIPTPWRSRGKNNLENFLGTGFITNNNISVSQKTEKGSFRVSMTHAYEKGQVPNTKLNNVTFTIGGTAKISEKFDMEGTWTYNKQFSPNYPAIGYGQNNYIYNLLVWSGTDYDLRDFKDYWLVPDVQQKYYQYTQWYNNPYFLANEKTDGYYHDGGYGSTNLTYKIKDNLKVISRTGVRWSNDKNEHREPISYMMKEGNFSLDQKYTFDLNSDLLVNYNTSIADVVDIDCLLGGSLSYYEYKELKAYTDGLNVPGFYHLSNSKNPIGAQNTLKQKQLNSAYGKISLAYKNGLFVDLTGRNDWSSSLSKDNRSYFYPSVAVSNIISEFVDLPSPIFFWKVRGSWTVSKMDNELYSLSNVYSVNNDAWNGNSTAYYGDKILNSDIEPTVNRTFEVGTDVSLFSNKLRFDFAYFNKLRTNIIAEGPLSSSTGFTHNRINTDAEYEQKGYEITVNATPIKKQDFVWNTTFNWSSEHWYLKKIDPLHTDKYYWIQEGKRTDVLASYDWARDHKGNIIHQNGYPVAENYPSVFGKEEEDFVWGFINNFKYKSFDLVVALDGRVGGIMYSKTNQAMWNSGTHPGSVNKWRENSSNGIYDYVGPGVIVTEGEITRDESGRIIEDTRKFAPNETTVSYIDYIKKYNPSAYHGKYQNYFDKTFFKLREVVLTYNVNNQIAKKVGMKRASVSLIGRNLLLWTKDLDFVDPDSNKDDLSSASHRNIGFNVKLSF